MTLPSADMRDVLVAAGVGTKGTSSGWSIYIGREPDAVGSVPHTVITIYDTGGNDANPKNILDYPSFQCRVRGAVGDYQAAYLKQLEIKDTLLGKSIFTINTTQYTGIWQVGDIIFVDYDDNNRPIITSNWRVARNLASSVNRTALS